MAAKKKKSAVGKVTAKRKVSAKQKKGSWGVTAHAEKRYAEAKAEYHAAGRAVAKAHGTKIK